MKQDYGEWALTELKKIEYIIIAILSIILGVFTSFQFNDNLEIDYLSLNKSLINKCDSNSNIYNCLGAVVKDLTINDKDDIKNIIKILNNKNYGAYCYYAAENIGKRAYQIFKDKGISYGFLDCETGYYHGYMIAQALDNVDIKEISESCQKGKDSYIEKDNWTPSMMLTCLVGVGRAIASLEKDISQAGVICENNLKDNLTEERGQRKAIDFCIRGVINDLTNINTEIDDVIKACLKLGEKEKSRSNNCLAIGLREPAAQSYEKTNKLAIACKELEELFPNPELDTSTSRYCYYALSDTIGERFNGGLEIGDTAIKICSNSSPCPGHMAKYLLNATWNKEVAKKGCEILNNKVARTNCNNSVIYLYEALKEQGHIRN